MAVEVLPRCLAARDEEEVVGEQAAWIGESEDRVDEEGKGHALFCSAGQ